MDDARPVPGYESYSIYKDGRVVNKNGHIIKPILFPAGIKVELRQNGQRELVSVHELIELCWGDKNETEDLNTN